MKFIKTLSFCFVFFAHLCLAKNETKYYEPKIEQLSGTVVLLTFPGRPNYSSIKDGDKAETCPYLLLDKPIDVAMIPTIPSNSKIGYDPENNIRLVQLVVMNKLDREVMKNGMQISLYGKLFGAHTGHHHAKVLIEVNKCSVIKENTSTGHIKLSRSIAHSLSGDEFEKCCMPPNAEVRS